MPSMQKAPATTWLHLKQRCELAADTISGRSGLRSWCLSFGGQHADALKLNIPWTFKADNPDGVYDIIEFHDDFDGH